ncbi:uncharacterized protein EAE97_003760 [Botrytis byssoidea]|uniref:Heterokaryon incompatibility domain-containing protein n=1 Tax=Botrytis byssoidea TaxID=139641 RepID=A0A9P5INN4_9HELO|nr:uncharacterized protein EAE97_003760 [Botrytis byssoidea]KAF7948349.1 hypothetical protein EAE97_003760 [Botrytis byssoidea]
MHQTYKHATNVRVWLGNDDQSIDIRAGLALISHCLTKFEQVRGRKNSKLESDWDILYSTSWDTIISRALFGEFKEIITGKEMNVSFETVGAKYRKAKRNPSYKKLASTLDLSMAPRDLPSECRIEPEVTLRINHLITSIIEYNGAFNLGKLLSNFRGKGSKMPEDQIFSLLGLTVEKNARYNKHRHVKFPEIDYKQSIQKLCTDTTKYILAQDNNLDVLRMVNTHAKPVNDKQWPSWVPNFTSPVPGSGEPKSSCWQLPPADISRTKLPREKIINTENDKLQIYGHVLSEIRKPVGIVENNGRRDKALEHEKRPIGIWEDSEGREVHGTVDVKKGDLVVMVARSERPLILRRLKGEKGKECEWPEYNVVGTAHIPELDLLKFNDLAKKIKWDFQKMAIV